MSEWKMTRLKNLLALPLAYGLNVSSEDDRRDWPRYIRITDFDDYNNLSEDSFKSLPFYIAETAKLEEGDLLFARSGATAGKTFLYSSLPNGACYAGYLIRARFNKKVVLPKFVSYYTKSTDYINWKNRYCIQTTIQNISAEKYYQLPIGIPSLTVQQRIVDCLDEKTLAIDSRTELLGRKKDAYVRLKKAIINRAVNRGLDENVKLKDSGVEWIGMIPEHWEVKRTKELCTFISRGATPTYVDEGEYKVMNQAIFSTGSLNHDIVRYSSYMKTESNIRKGDLIIASTGGGVLGKLYFFEEEDSDFYADTHVTIVRNDKGTFHVKFLYYLLSHQFDMINAFMAKGSTNQTELQRDQLLSYELAVPPLKEQQAIITYLDEQCTKIDAAIVNIDKQIDALKRLKRSLINEVITGQRAV